MSLKYLFVAPSFDDIKKLEKKSDIKGLIRILESPKQSDKWKEARRGASYSLITYADSTALDSLIGALHHDDFVVRRNVAEALGNLKDARAKDALLLCLNDEDGSVRSNVILALGKLKEYRVIDTLITLLYGDNPSWSAIEALGDMGNASAKATPQLIILLNTTNNHSLKQKILEALAKIGDLSVIPHLIERLRLRDYSVFGAIDKLLGKNKSLSDSATSQFVALILSQYVILRESDRKMVLEFLQQITPTESDSLEVLMPVLDDTTDKDLLLTVARMVRSQWHRLNKKQQTQVAIILQNKDMITQLQTDAIPTLTEMANDAPSTAMRQFSAEMLYEMPGVPVDVKRLASASSDLAWHDLKNLGAQAIKTLWALKDDAQNGYYALVVLQAILEDDEQASQIDKNLLNILSRMRDITVKVPYLLSKGADAYDPDPYDSERLDINRLKNKISSLTDFAEYNKTHGQDRLLELLDQFGVPCANILYAYIEMRSEVVDCSDIRALASFQMRSLP